MDMYDFDDMKVKKSAASSSSILWYNHLPISLTKLFRLIELCLAMVLFFWIFNRLPFAVRISGQFFRQVAGVIASPLFVFFLCNAIIVTLIVKSDRFPGENPATYNAEAELYEELLKNHRSSSSKQLSPEDSSTPLPDATGGEEIEFQDKEIISQVNAAGGGDCNVVVMEMSFVSDSEADSDSESDSDTPRFYRRWKSEKQLERKDKEMMKLRRSETEKFIKSRGGENDDVLCPGEELSAEEFQKAVDDFIAKHLRFRRQESLDFAQNQNSFSKIEKI